MSILSKAVSMIVTLAAGVAGGYALAKIGENPELLFSGADDGDCTRECECECGECVLDSACTKNRRDSFTSSAVTRGSAKFVESEDEEDEAEMGDGGEDFTRDLPNRYPTPNTQPLQEEEEEAGIPVADSIPSEPAEADDVHGDGEQSEAMQDLAAEADAAEDTEVNPGDIFGTPEEKHFEPEPPETEEGTEEGRKEGEPFWI